MEWLLIWLVCAFICSIVAGNKRRSALAWFIVGLLLGPLALIAVLCSGEAGTPCPFCKKNVDPKATKCPYCQSDIEPSQHPVKPNSPKGPVTPTGRIVAGLGLVVGFCSLYVLYAWGVWDGTMKLLGLIGLFAGVLLFLFGIGTREVLPEPDEPSSVADPA